MRRARRATVAAYRKRWEDSVSSSGRAAVKNVSEDVVRELEAQMLPCLFGAAIKWRCTPKTGMGGYWGTLWPSFTGYVRPRDETSGVASIWWCGGVTAAGLRSTNRLSLH